MSTFTARIVAFIGAEVKGSLGTGVAGLKFQLTARYFPLGSSGNRTCFGCIR